MSEFSAEHCEQVGAVLSRVYRRNGRTAYDFADARTPLSELLQDEPESDVTGDCQSDAISEEVAEERLNAFRRAMQYIFADGPHPGHAMRRVYALARGVQPELLQGMNDSDLAIIFDEEQASQSARLNVMFSGYLKKAEAKGTNAPSQKAASAIPKCAAAQRGN